MFIRFELCQQLGLDSLILEKFVQIISQQLFGSFRLQEMTLCGVQQKFHHLDTHFRFPLTDFTQKFHGIHL